MLPVTQHKWTVAGTCISWSQCSFLDVVCSLFSSDVSFFAFGFFLEGTSVHSPSITSHLYTIGLPYTTVKLHYIHYTCSTPAHFSVKFWCQFTQVYCTSFSTARKFNKKNIRAKTHEIMSTYTQMYVCCTSKLKHKRFKQIKAIQNDWKHVHSMHVYVCHK